MAEESNTSTAPTPTSSETPQAGAPTPQPQAGYAPEPQAGDGHENISLEEARKLRSESANLRKRLKSYEDAEKAAQEAALGEVEKATKRANEAEQRIKQYQQELITAQVKLAAQGKGIIDPDLAALAIQSTLEYGDDGMPTNVEKALDQLIKNKPFLAPKPATPTEQPPVSPSPAQTAPAPTIQTPTIPAMNPGRNAIQPPNPIPAGPVRLSDVWKR